MTFSRIEAPFQLRDVGWWCLTVVTVACQLLQRYDHSERR